MIWIVHAFVFRARIALFALRVAGDSMAPVLDSREVILIDLDAAPRVDDLIVARLPDQSHVVKRVASS